MNRTPEQQAARDEVEKAIDKYLVLIEMPGIRTNFAVVTENVVFNSEEGKPSSDYYGIMFSNDSMTNALAKGLFYHAIHLLDFGQGPNDDSS